MSAGAYLLLAGLGMICVGGVTAWVWNRGQPGNWPALGLGALAWVIGVGLKIAWAVPTNRHVLGAFRAVFPSVIASPISHIYIGLLTGIFECGVVFLMVRRSRLRQASWNQAMAAGIGKGGIEAVLLGGLVFLGGLAALLSWRYLSADQRANLLANASVATVVTRPLERAFALAGHVFSTVLIVHAVRTRRVRWFWLSFAFLSAVDALDAWGIEVFGRASLALRPEFWAVFALTAAIAVVGLVFLKRRFPPVAG